MERMTSDEVRQFILAKPRPAIAAVICPDGRPHATPVWIALDGDQIVFTTFHTALKARALRHDPRISLVIDDDAPPFAYVTLSGTVTISEDPAELRYWAGRLGARYMGEGRAEEYAERNGVPGELLIHVRVTQAIGHRGVAA